MSALIFLSAVVCVVVLFFAVRWMVRPTLSRLVLTPMLIVVCTPMLLAALELGNTLTWHRATTDQRAQIKEHALTLTNSQTEIVKGKATHTSVYTAPGSTESESPHVVRVPEFVTSARLVSYFSLFLALGVGFAWVCLVCTPGLVRWHKSHHASVKPIRATQTTKRE